MAAAAAAAAPGPALAAPRAPGARPAPGASAPAAARGALLGAKPRDIQQAKQDELREENDMIGKR